MKGRFQRLPIHRKLVVLALMVSAASLVVALIGLSLADLWRYHEAAEEETEALAKVLAENVAAAMDFDDVQAARATLASVRVREEIAYACVYRNDGSLFTGFSARSDAACPLRPASDPAWNAVTGSAVVTRNDRMFGVVSVERRLSDLGRRLLLMAAIGLLMLLVAGAAAYLLAERVHAAISRPISQLAVTARAFGRDHDIEIPAIKAAPDEVGELVASFGDMVSHVRAASDESRISNEALRRENEERRRVEGELEAALLRERQTSRLKDEFLAAVSHELRTPLNAIVGWAQILDNAPPTEQTLQRAVASIARNAAAQTRVIDDLIDVSRIITGKLRLNFADVDLRITIGASLESIRPTAEAKGVAVEAHLPSSPCLVSGDKDRLQQVLWNLLSNAVKFTARGGRVAVALSRHDAAYAVTVADTGIGIAPEFVPHVFERFRQADGSMTRQQGGLGLGLAIVQDLTELHGGTVMAASKGLGQGAVFTVTLPESVTTAAAKGGTAAAAGEPEQSLVGVRVLALDDNEDALEIIAAVLTGAGSVVTTTLSAQDAIDIWESEPADVFICDLAMPKMSGFDVLAKIRAIDVRKGRVTRAIAISAHAAENWQAESRRAGFQQHLTKPFMTGDLVRAVAQAVQHA